MEILKEGWLLDWVQRAREEIPMFLYLPLAVCLLNLAMRVTSSNLPNFFDCHDLTQLI